MINVAWKLVPVEPPLKERIADFFRRLTCNHDSHGTEFVRVGNRMLWQCKSCGHFRWEAGYGFPNFSPSQLPGPRDSRIDDQLEGDDDE